MFQRLVRCLCVCAFVLFYCVVGCGLFFCRASVVELCVCVWFVPFVLLALFYCRLSVDVLALWSSTRDWRGRSVFICAFVTPPPPQNKMGQVIYCSSIHSRSSVFRRKVAATDALSQFLQRDRHKRGGEGGWAERLSRGIQSSNIVRT